MKKVALTYGCLLLLLGGCSLVSSQGAILNASARSYSLQLNADYKARYLEHQVFASPEEVNTVQETSVPHYDLVLAEASSHSVVYYLMPDRYNLYAWPLVGEMPWQKSGRLYPHMAAVQVVDSAEGRAPKLSSIVCKSNWAGISKPPLPTLESARLVCGSESIEIFRDDS
ncbi:MAG: hypothetical protein AAFR58_20390 [Cyanobacteria bacterium J06627_28]